ncbi:hypothetical protein RD792_003942 [Penstemon davidsonii]|uniref:Cytochrome P450 n=1 Tax=Penstemon davidsonii TaxID=160366 RepID=A0ABR0DG27_9LAMI|nr:hypothetical protein RD792_003942 [Penstemon davidsonii]
MDSFFSIALLSFLILLISIFLLLKKSKILAAPLPPGPRGLPILGFLPYIQKNLHFQFDKLAHKYGPIYKLWLGSKLCVVISSPSLMKEIVREHDVIFANHDFTVAGMIATSGGIDIVQSDYGPYWRKMRKLFVREMLSNNNLDASYTLRRDEVRRAIKNVYDCKIGMAINIGELIFLTEINVVLSLIWGGTVDESNRDRTGVEFKEKVSKLIELLDKPNVSDFFPVLEKFDFQGIMKELMNGVLPGIEETLDFVINKRKKMMLSGQVEEEEEEEKSDGARKKDFLQILLELKDEDGQPMTHTQIRVFLMDIVVGGTETTATTVEWVMAELLNNPDVMKRVQQELLDVVGKNNIVEESHISKLQCLDAAVKETFRLHPPLPFLIPRRPSESCIVGGYTVPKGSRVLMNVWSGYRDPQIWENPSEFKPERFLKEGSTWDYAGSNFQYLPFGSGRRICPGLPLAEKMVMYMLATFLHSFDWKLQEGEKLDMSEKFGIVMKKNKPLFAIPYQRLPDSNMYQ